MELDGSREEGYLVERVHFSLLNSINPNNIDLSNHIAVGHYIETYTQNHLLKLSM